MLRIIEPPSHGFYQSKIDTLLNIFKIYQNLELSLEEQAKTTFIVAEDPKCGVYGGALLYKKKVRTFEDRIEKIISALYSNKRKVWAVKLCLCIEEDETLLSFEKLDLFQDFYSSLLKKFMNFGRQENASFLVLSLRPTDFFKTKTHSYWPYLLEIQPKDSFDGLFHGILDLKSLRPKAYTNPWQTVDRLNQMRRIDV